MADDRRQRRGAFAAFPGEYSSVALLPEFIGAIGLPVALVFAAIQYAVAVQFRKAKVLCLVTGFFVVGVLLGTIGHTIDRHGFCAEHIVSFAEYLLCEGSHFFHQ